MNQSFGGSCRCDCGYAAPKLGAQFWLLHQRRWLVISQIQRSRPGWPTRRSRKGAQHRLHSNRSYRRSLDFAHIPMVYSGHRTIVPSDRGCIPAYFGDSAAISGIAAPINAATLLETFGFGGNHRPLPLMPCHRRAVFQPLLCVRLCVAPPFRLSSSVFPHSAPVPHGCDQRVADGNSA